MNRTVINVLIFIVIAGLAGATAYVYMKSQEEITNNRLLVERFNKEAESNPPVVLKTPTPVPAFVASTSTSPGTPSRKVDTSGTIIENWPVYESEMFGFSFQYPSAATLEIAGDDEYWPEVVKHEGLVARLDYFTDLPYETYSKKNIFIGIDGDRTTFASCIQGETSKKTRPDGTVLHKVPLTPDCAMDGCSVGFHYKVFKKNACYDVTVVGIQANPAKLYDAGDPKLNLADQQNLVAKARLFDIAEKIASTIKWK